MRFMNMVKRFVALMLTLTLLGGCTFPWNIPFSPSKVTLKICCVNEKAFNLLYGDVFRAKYPQITLEVQEIPPTLLSSANMHKGMVEAFEKYQPDIFLTTVAIYKDLYAQNKLYDISSFLNEETFHLEELHSGMVEYVRGVTNGELQALPIWFNTPAFFYNKKLFQEHGVPFPKNKMSWESLFEVMNRFPSKHTGQKRLYPFLGIYSDELINAHDWMGELVLTEAIREVSSDYKKVNLRGKRWKELLQTVVYQSKKGFLSPYYASSECASQIVEASKQDFFIQGQVAMTIDDAKYISELEASPHAIDWGVTALPIDPAHPDENPYMSVNEVIIVNKTAHHMKEIKEFLAFASSQEEGERRLNLSFGFLPVRMPKKTKSQVFKTLYATRPGTSDIPRHRRDLPSKYKKGYADLFEREFKDLLANKITTDEFIDRVEKQAQLILDTCALEKKEEEKTSEK